MFLSNQGVSLEQAPLLESVAKLFRPVLVDHVLLLAFGIIEALQNTERGREFARIANELVPHHSELRTTWK